MRFDATETSFIPLAWLVPSPAILRNQIYNRIFGCRGICHRAQGYPSYIKTTLTSWVSYFMGIEVTETYPIPPRSWFRAQKPPAIRSRIGVVVVELSAIEIWDCQHSLQTCNFMNNSSLGMNPIPVYSWHRTQ